MKKQLLSIFAALSISTFFAQVPAAVWSTNQNAVFPTTLPNTGVKFMDAVDANVVWVIGRDYTTGGFNRNYNWYSRSINGGSTFAGGNVYSDTNTYIIANLEGLDANTAWVSAYKKQGPGTGNGGGGIHRTTNGGTNWVNMTPSAMFTGTASFCNWVTFFTPLVGVVNGDPVNGEYEMWRTIDGGLSWTQIPGTSIPDPLPGEFAIVNLYARVGTSNLWFGTNGNRMFRSTDAGITYSVSSVGAVSTNTITEIAFSSPLNGVCYMVNAGAQLELWNTYDGGVNWSQVNPLPANLGTSDVVQVPGTGNLVSFDGTNGNPLISYSIDNGLTWVDFGSTGIQYPTGDFVDGSTGWAGGIDIPTSNLTDVWKFSGVLTGTASPSASFLLPPTICLSGPTSTVLAINTSSGSPTALSYTWSVSPAGATLSSPTATSPLITFSSANSYTVTLIATNAVGTNTTSWVVDVAACTAPAATFTLSANACTGFSFTPSNTSTGAPAPGYLWSILPATNVTLSSANATNPEIRIANSGSYSVTLFVSNASGTAQSTQVVSVTACPPVVSFTMPSFVCLSDAASTKTFQTTNLTANPPQAGAGTITYTWSIAPSSGVSVLPNYFSTSLTKVTLNNANPNTYTVTLRARNPSGTATFTQTIGAGPCTGISEKGNLEDILSVYPNPAHEQINIALPVSNDTYKVKLTNILGSVVFEEKIIKNTKETMSVSLTNKPKGIYFLTVELNSEKVTKKIVVE